MTQEKLSESAALWTAIAGNQFNEAAAIVRDHMVSNGHRVNGVEIWFKDTGHVSAYVWRNEHEGGTVSSGYRRDALAAVKSLADAIDAEPNPRAVKHAIDLAALAKAVAGVLDQAKELGVEGDFTAPLRDMMYQLSSNIVEAPGAAAFRSVRAEGDEAPGLEPERAPTPFIKP